jgi:hypothetical protein
MRSVARKRSPPLNAASNVPWRPSDRSSVAVMIVVAKRRAAPTARRYALQTSSADGSGRAAASGAVEYSRGGSGGNVAGVTRP